MWDYYRRMFKLVGLDPDYVDEEINRCKANAENEELWEDYDKAMDTYRDVFDLILESKGLVPLQRRLF